MRRRFTLAAAALAAALRAGAALGDVWTDAAGVAWTYTVSDGAAELFNDEEAVIPTTTSGSLVVPSSLGGYPLVRVGEWAFASCTGLVEVTIPECVTDVGPFAFSGCSGLKTVTMPRIEDCNLAFFNTSDDLVVRYWDEIIPYALTLKARPSSAGGASGRGKYMAGTRVKIKAKAGKGRVFAGWFTDRKCTKALNPEGYDNRKPTVRIDMPPSNTTLYAKFATSAQAAKSLKFKESARRLAKTAAKCEAGAPFYLRLGISSLSLPSVTAKNLPKGLSVDKTTGVVSGTPRKPGSYSATVKVKDAAGNRISQKVKIAVRVPSWARGSFRMAAIPGCDDDAWSRLRFKIGSTGKVSGKVAYNGKSYSFESTVSSCTAARAKFRPKIKVGNSSLSPGVVVVDAKP